MSPSDPSDLAPCSCFLNSLLLLHSSFHLCSLQLSPLILHTHSPLTAPTLPTHLSPLTCLHSFPAHSPLILPTHPPLSLATVQPTSGVAKGATSEGRDRQEHMGGGGLTSLLTPFQADKLNMLAPLMRAPNPSSSW